MHKFIALVFLLCFKINLYSQNLKVYLIDNGTTNTTLSNPNEFIAALRLPLSGEFNLQAAYSPFRHFSFSLGLYKHNTINKNIDPNIRSRIEYNNQSASGSIGTYFFIRHEEQPSRRKRNRNERLKDFIKNEKGFLINAKLGMSISESINLKKGINIVRTFYQLNYFKYYLNVGFFHKFRFGEIGLTNKFIRARYTKARIDGSGFDPRQIYSSIDKIEENSRQILYSINLLAKFGSKQIKFFCSYTNNNTFLRRNSISQIDQELFQMGLYTDIIGLYKLIKRKY